MQKLIKLIITSGRIWVYTPRSGSRVQFVDSAFKDKVGFYQLWNESFQSEEVVPGIWIIVNAAWPGKWCRFLVTKLMIEAGFPLVVDDQGYIKGFLPRYYFMRKDASDRIRQVQEMVEDTGMLLDQDSHVVQRIVKILWTYRESSEEAEKVAEKIRDQIQG